MKKWQVGEECWFLQSYCIPVQGVIKAVQGEFCVLKYGAGKGIRLRTTRLYKSESEAREAIPNYGRRWHNPYDYEH